MKPNIKLRSNVYIRTDPSLARDVDFQRQVRGRAALEKMLGKIGGSETWLTLQQRLQYRIDLACVKCGAIPEGPVRRNGSVSYEFRCPGKECIVKPTTIVRVDLDRQTLEQCNRTLGPDIDANIQRALDLPFSGKPIPLEDSFIIPSCVVKLTRYQGHIFGSYPLPKLSEIVNSALLNLLREEKSARNKSEAI